MKPVAEWVLKGEQYAADVLDEMLDIYCDSRGLDRKRDLKVRSSKKLGICWVVQDLSRRGLI